ncbi:host specificity factor TipJ family phage tail protein [Bordetella trematum]|uniref:host specificity factor TipJ family phage tail protein n=1 Tax=Bordetella trematum TaxID=123899 RepID=UPI003AF3A12A
MTIKVYPSLLPGLPIEEHAAEGVTLGEWLSSKGIDSLAHEIQPVEVWRNGQRLAAEDWGSVVIRQADDVQIRLIPNGGVFKALGSIIGKVFNLAFGWLMPKSRSQSHRSPEQGSRLENSQATANSAKLGEVVPELAGRFRRFPDYLTPPRRRFVGRREQWLEFLCCVGPGRYQIDPADVKIGNTSFSALGDDAQYEILEPGDDVAGKPGHEHWYTSDEVGGTSSGTAGLELSAEFSSEVNPDASSYDVDGALLTMHGATVPAGWGAGTMMAIAVYMNYEVSRDVFSSFPETTYINRFTGNFRELSPGYGMTVDVGYGSEIITANIRDYSVDQDGVGWVTLVLDDGVPFNALEPGTHSMRFFIRNRRYRAIAFPAENQVEVVANEGDIDVVGWRGFAPYQGGVSVSVDSATIYGDWSGAFLACPPGELTDAMEADFFFPGGLGYVADNGRLRDWSVRVEIQYRDARAGGAFSSQLLIYSDATLDQIGFTERIDFGGMIRPEVRVRRRGAQDTSTQVNDKIQWYGLRTRLNTRDEYPDWTTMSVRIRSGGRLGAQSENQVNVVATRVLPRLQSDGVWSPPQPTRDISAFVRHIAASIGYTDANLDMDELRRLHAIWAARGETFDHVYDATTVKEALNLALGAGMSEFTVHDGLILPVRDGLRTQFEQSYSPHNMTGPLVRAFRAPRVDDFDGVEVEYTDGETWAQETVKCLLPGDQGFKLDKIQLRGVTDRTRAWRVGMRRRRELRYRRWDYSFPTEMDALNSRYLSYVPLIGDDPGYGASAILKHIEPAGGQALLHVSEPVSWEPDAHHVVAYRRPDGTLAGPFSARPGDDEYVILADIPKPWPAVTLKQEPPHVYFGTVERWCFPALITGIRPSGMESAQVEAENYDPRVYASDDEQPSG